MSAQRSADRPVSVRPRRLLALPSCSCRELGSRCESLLFAHRHAPAIQVEVTYSQVAIHATRCAAARVVRYDIRRARLPSARFLTSLNNTDTHLSTNTSPPNNISPNGKRTDGRSFNAPSSDFAPRDPDPLTRSRPRVSQVETGTRGVYLRRCVAASTDPRPSGEGCELDERGTGTSRPRPTRRRVCRCRICRAGGNAAPQYRQDSPSNSDDNEAIHESSESKPIDSRLFL